MPPNPADITPAINLQAEHGAGPVRARKPAFVDLLPPCNHACPAGENIQAWLALAQAGHYQAAWEVLLNDNPMPAVHGRVCYHPCETSCNRTPLDAAVSIHAVERFLGDTALAQGWLPRITAPPSGKRVLIVGAGPSGLAAAYHLARAGHTVELHEAGPLPGGMLHFGIPAYRLPRDVLAQEIARITGMGVRILCNLKVTDLAASMAAGRFDAAFIAIGAHVSRHADIPAREAARVLDAVSYLHDVSAGTPPQLGRRVVIYGGGNTAMDAARTARRLGADEAVIVYRRDRAHMPAHGFEADEAIEEGVKIRWLSTITDFAGQELTVERMRRVDGRPEPTGEFDTVPADAVILAQGQETDSGFLRAMPGIAFKPDGTVIVGPDMMTGAAGIFAGGDMVPSERTVTIATGHGKKAARHIDAYLRQIPLPHTAKHPLVSFPMLHLPVFTDAAPATQPSRSLPSREGNFGEILSGLTAAAALREAQRCLSCGNCFACDNCFAACPEQAIIKLGPNQTATPFYRIDDRTCTGCAVCYDQCPCHAIEMIPDPASTAEPRT